MELKELKLKNYGSFYGENTIKFGPSLTLIIGNNGDGKTTVFDALQWLLDTTNSAPQAKRISQKLVKELEEGVQREVGVELLCEHQGQNILLKKNFFISLQQGNLKVPDKANQIAYKENLRGERTQEDMVKLIGAIFNPSIQEFCLFKGEAELNVLNKKQALGELLSRLSDISQLDKYMKTAQAMANKASKAVMDELKKGNKTQKEAESISEEKERLKSEKAGVEERLERARGELEASKQLFDSLEANEAIWKEYQGLNDEKNRVLDEIATLMHRTDVVPNIKLLDDLWILKDFDGIFEKFKDKVSFWAKEKRSLEIDRVREEAELKSQVKISNEIKSKLPIQIPDVSTLETLIAEERCEICGREAKKGSPAYQHMCDRLKELREYLAGLPKEEPKLPPLFPCDYIGEINTIYRNLTGEKQAELNRKMHLVDERMCQLNLDRKKLQEKRKELGDWDARINNLLIVNHITDEEKFFGPTQRAFFDSSERIGDAKGKIGELERQKNQFESDISSLDAKLSSLALNSPHVAFLSKVSDILNSLLVAYKEGREENASQFVAKLEAKANKYFDALNTKDFHGFIKLIRNEGSDEIKIQLQSNTGEEIPLANTAQKTSEYLAVLFAISELSNSKNGEVYPLVFDAPTSSFSAGKEGDFYNIVTQFQKQCVILTKDLLKPDGTLDLERIERLNCSVIRIQQNPNFVKGDVSTVQTEIKEVKV